MRLLQEYNVKCTVYANGQALEMNPDVAVKLSQAGHEIASHGYRWVTISNCVLLGYKQKN